MKANRAQYRRSWAAANRALRNNKFASSVIPDSNEESQDSDSFELSFNASPHTSDHSNSDSEQGEPSQKSARSSPQPNLDLHNNDFMDVENTNNCSSDSDDDSSRDDSLRKGLVNWTNKFSIKQNAVDGLLLLLKRSGHPDLPGCARTLLQTPRTISIQKKSGMEYVYFPLAAQLLKHFKRYPAETVHEIHSLEISLNIDGLPLFKSSNTNLWPVLCAIVNVKPVMAFPVVLTCGSSKPMDLEFLDDLIKDLDNVLKNGVQDGNRVLQVSLRCCVCDAPARALVKGTKLCSGYFGCDKCAQKGMWVGRVVYPEVKNVALRTDASFRDQVNQEHHNCISPFGNLPIDMVRQFPIDYMHQLCLGVMRKLVLLWMRGNLAVI